MPNIFESENGLLTKVECSEIKQFADFTEFKIPIHQPDSVYLFLILKELQCLRRRLENLEGIAPKEIANYHMGMDDEKI